MNAAADLRHLARLDRQDEERHALPDAWWNELTEVGRAPWVADFLEQERARFDAYRRRMYWEYIHES